MKEIHFYTNLCNEEQTSDWDLETMQTDIVSTLSELKNNESLIKTTQLSLLRNTWDFIKEGRKVIIHNGLRTIEIEDGIFIKDREEVKTGDDILSLLLDGEFGELC